MQTLADEIVRELPRMMRQHLDGPQVKHIAAFLAVPDANVREAMRAIKQRESAVVVRYSGSKARHVVPVGHSFGFSARACRYCDLLFEVPPKAKRQCCSRKCSNAWSWTQPGVRERRVASIRAERTTPKAKARVAAHNKRRWSKPEEREKLREQNRREWADPVKRAKRSAGIQAAHGTVEKRKFYADKRRANWADPDYRERTAESMRAAHRRPEVRAKFSKLLTERWQDPHMRAKYMEANRNRNSAAKRDRASKRMTAFWNDPANASRRFDAVTKMRQTKLATDQMSDTACAVAAILCERSAPMTVGNLEHALGQECSSIRNALRVLERRDFVRRLECGEEQARPPGSGKGGQPKFTWEVTPKVPDLFSTKR